MTYCLASIRLVPPYLAIALASYKLGTLWLGYLRASPGPPSLTRHLATALASCKLVGVCLRACVHAHTCMVCACVCTRVCVRGRVCVRACVYMRVCLCVRAHVQVCVHVCVLGIDPSKP